VGEQIREDRELEQRANKVLRSQVACAVLGLVIEQPSHGYEIGKRLEERFGGILSTGRSMSAVYAALTALFEAGLIEKLPGRAQMGSRQGAKAGSSYRATALGARAYRAWLAVRVQQDPDRLDMLGRMTLAGVNSAEAALDFIEHYEQQSLNQAKGLVGPARQACGCERWLYGADGAAISKTESASQPEQYSPHHQTLKPKKPSPRALHGTPSPQANQQEARAYGRVPQSTVLVTVPPRPAASRKKFTGYSRNFATRAIGDGFCWSCIDLLRNARAGLVPV
jgi:DNA-binding PadR family transcriptional regulator